MVEIIAIENFITKEFLGSLLQNMNMSHFSYSCKTEGKNGISHLISAVCINCLSAIQEYSRLNNLDVHLV